MSVILACVCRNKSLATLEFDRDRKSMSVICSAPLAAPAASSGIQTRSGTTGKPEHGHKLLVKGAAECLLGRSTHVSKHLADRVWPSEM